jgi:hypothetical protein
MPVVVKGWEEAVTAEPVPPLAEQQARAEQELAQVVAAALTRAPNEAGRFAVEQTVICGSAGRTLVSQAADCRPARRWARPPVDRNAAPVGELYCVRHASCPVVVIPPAMATRKDLNPAAASVPG